ncbi:MAG: tripartite tricarboxylate transporter substrate binding protein [Burkholderiaceae bacterium]
MFKSTHQPITRRVAQALLVTLCAASIAGAAFAQDYPNKPIKIVVPSAAGGGNDFIARTLGRKMAENMKQPVVIENKPGASNMIGTEYVAKSPADGYTLLFNGPLILQAASLYSKVPYDPIADFTPITDVIRTPLWFAVSTAKVHAHSLKEFVDEAKKQAHGFTYGSGGAGSSHHLYGFGLAEATGIQMTHVPYKGGAPAMTALVGGEIDSGFFDYVSLRPFVESGKVTLLAVTGTKRPVLTPNVPTMSELGYPGFESYGWGALFVPSKTPPEIVQRLETEIVKALRSPEVSGKFKDAGFDLGGTPQAQFAAQYKADQARWASLIKRSATKLD